LDGAEFVGINLPNALSERPSGLVMLGWWTKWAIAMAIAGLAVVGAAPARADTTVAVQRLGVGELHSGDRGQRARFALAAAAIVLGLARRLRKG